MHGPSQEQQMLGQMAQGIVQFERRVPTAMARLDLYEAIARSNGCTELSNEQAFLMNAVLVDRDHFASKVSRFGSALADRLDAGRDGSPPRASTAQLSRQLDALQAEARAISERTVPHVAAVMRGINPRMGFSTGLVTSGPADLPPSCSVFGGTPRLRIPSLPMPAQRLDPREVADFVRSFNQFNAGIDRYWKSLAPRAADMRDVIQRRGEEIKDRTGRDYGAVMAAMDTRLAQVVRLGRDLFEKFNNTPGYRTMNNLHRLRNLSEERAAVMQAHGEMFDLVDDALLRPR